MYIFQKTSSVFHKWIFIREEFQSQYRWLDEHLAEAPQEIIWETRHKDVRKIVLPASLGGGAVAYKFYRNVRPLRFFLQPSAALREGRGFFIVRQLKIPLVDTLALGEDRVMGYLKSSFFISRFAEGYQGGRALQHENMSADDLSLQREFIEKNLTYLARLHKAGYSHGGAHYDNFIWRRGTAGGLEVRWLDLATVKKLPLLGKRRRILRDLDMFLNCFALSGAERQNYLDFYRSVFRNCGQN